MLQVGDELTVDLYPPTLYSTRVEPDGTLDSNGPVPITISSETALDSLLVQQLLSAVHGASPEASRVWYDAAAHSEEVWETAPGGTPSSDWRLLGDFGELLDGAESLGLGLGLGSSWMVRNH